MYSRTTCCIPLGPFAFALGELKCAVRLLNREKSRSHHIRMMWWVETGNDFFFSFIFLPVFYTSISLSLSFILFSVHKTFYGNHMKTIHFFFSIFCIAFWAQAHMCPQIRFNSWVYVFFFRLPQRSTIIHKIEWQSHGECTKWIICQSSYLIYSSLNGSMCLGNSETSNKKSYLTILEKKKKNRFFWRKKRKNKASSQY